MHRRNIFMKKMARIYRKLYYLVCSDERYLEKKYKKVFGRKPVLKNPKTFSEKLLYLMLHYRNPLETLCADKYFVKEYIKACGLESIWRPILGVYTNVDDIPFDELPNEFFIRTNHLSGNNRLIDKNSFNDYAELKKFLSELLKINYYYVGREFCYKNIRPLVLVEKCLRDKCGNLPVDYKFYCFGGELKYFMISQGEFEHQVKNHKFNAQKESIEHYFKKESSLSEEDVVLPDNIDEMMNIAKTLCKPFPHVRVDLYNIDGKIYFGELTFHSNGGFVSIYDSDYDKEIGSWIDLDKYKDAMI